MPKGKKYGGKDFKKGHKGYKPKGAVSVPSRLKELNRKKMEELFSRFLRMTGKELHDQSEREDITAIEMMTIRLIQKCLKEGNFNIFNFMLDRTIGKAVSAEDNDDDGKNNQAGHVVTLTMPSNGRENLDGKEEQEKIQGEESDSGRIGFESED